MNSTPLATVADAIEFNRKRRQQIATTPLNRPRKMSAVVRKLSLSESDEITPPNQGVWKSTESQTRKIRKMTRESGKGA